MTYPSVRVISHSLQKGSRNCCHFFQNPPTCTIKMNKMRSCAVSFIRKNWSKSFNKGIVYNRVGFKCICATISRQYTELFYKLFTRASESGWSMGGCNLRNIQAIKVPKCYGRKIHVFWQETFKLIRILLPGCWSLLFHYGYCWSREHSRSRKKQAQRNRYQS